MFAKRTHFLNKLLSRRVLRERGCPLKSRDISHALDTTGSVITLRYNSNLGKTDLLQQCLERPAMYYEAYAVGSWSPSWPSNPTYGNCACDAAAPVVRVAREGPVRPMDERGRPPSANSPIIAVWHSKREESLFIPPASKYAFVQGSELLEMNKYQVST